VAAEPADALASTTRWERLLDLDDDLAEALGEDLAARARDRVGVATVRLEEGAWSPDSLTAVARGAFALLVCDGLIVRELELAGTLTAELLGPGDMVDFGSPSEPLLATRERWHISGSAKAAILDDRVLPALHAWPALGSRLIARAARQAARAAEQRAISQLPRVELRIRALLWHLAERWGRMSPAGVVVPIELTHTALGHLVGARRSTVTLALGELSRLGLVARRDDGAWVLRADSNPSGVAHRAASLPGIAAIASDRPPLHRAVAAGSIASRESIVLAERIDRMRLISAQQQARTAAILAGCRATCELSASRRARWLSSRRAAEAPRP
jgi:CRP/FNR family transcriptional regulator, cyclic AMP receptor protein